MSTKTAIPNELINEKSPYLQQHAYNPVRWHPWNNETLQLAKKEDKPIFLSVGYSTCYWCHVMEREVFENEQIGVMMNDYFINIKVDREELPDVDRVYMISLQAMTGQGGWPMSMFLTPDLKPFYGATYIPPKAKYGRAGFEDVINEIHKLWQTKREDIVKSGENIVDLLEKKINAREKAIAEPIIKEDILHKAFDQFKSIYDYNYGGFGQGNKFPRPAALDFLTAYYKFSGIVESLDMVTFTLMKLYMGGINDHLAGGFHRYAVDQIWRVPHFEKMLYDQAQLINTYLDVYSITGKDIYLNIADSIYEYAMTNLHNDAGGFYTAEDAESAVSSDDPYSQQEGAFYLWTKDEVESVLPDEYAPIFMHYYGIQISGNTLNDPHEVFGNKNVLYIANDVFDTSKMFKRTNEEVIGILDECRKLLLEKRKNRPKPHLDDKIITSWNAMMISSFCKFYKKTEDEKYLTAAVSAMDFIMNNLYDNGRKKLFRRYKEGEAKFDGSLEDYALTIRALTDLYEVTFDWKYINKAVTLCDIAIELFNDSEYGGFFDAEMRDDIIFKTKEIYDGAEPSGNAIQILNLLKLSVFTGDSRYETIAEQSLKYFLKEVEKSPFSSPQMLLNILIYVNGVSEIVLNGQLKGKLHEMLKYINSRFLPFSVIIQASDKIPGTHELLKSIYEDSNNKDKVFLCKNFSCEIQTDNINELKNSLK